MIGDVECWSVSCCTSMVPAAGLRDTTLQPALRTGHQVVEEDAVQCVVHMQEAEAKPPLPEQ